MIALRSVLAVALAVVAAAPSAASAQKRQRDLITRAEILKAHEDQDLFVAVKALRPHFLVPPRGLRTLGGAPIGEVAVYVDGIRQLGVETLRSIIANTVLEVRYLDPSKSQNDYGITANAGAIIVKRWVTGADSVTRKPLR
jgi:hypothetical protein